MSRFPELDAMGSSELSTFIFQEDEISPAEYEYVLKLLRKAAA